MSIKRLQDQFEEFGGVSEIIVPDNLKAGVTKAHFYDPDINTNYQHFSEHYGFAIVPARAREPKDKAKVENAVGCVSISIIEFFIGDVICSVEFNKKNVDKKLFVCG